MKISVARMIANLAARGRALENRFAWWSRWFPPAATVDADRFQGDSDPYPDHWKQFPRAWPVDQPVQPEALKAAVYRFLIKYRAGSLPALTGIWAASSPTEPGVGSAARPLQWSPSARCCTSAFT